LGIGVTALLWIIYVIRAQGLIDLADRFKHSESAAQSRISKGIPDLQGYRNPPSYGQNLF